MGYLYDTLTRLSILLFETESSSNSIILSIAIYLITIACISVIAAPFRILVLRTINETATRKFNIRKLLETVPKFAVFSFAIFVLGTTISTVLWSLLPFIETGVTVEPILEAELEVHPEYLLATWLFDRANITISNAVNYFLCLLLVKIALGHPVKLAAMLKFQIQYLIPLFYVALLVDPIFFITELYLSSAFGRYYEDTYFDFTYFIAESVLYVVSLLLYHSIMFEFYRNYLSKTQSDTNASSTAASVFECKRAAHRAALFVSH